MEPTQYKIWDSAGKEVEQKITQIKMELEDSERKIDAFESRVFPIFAERAETIGDSNQVPLGVPIKQEDADLQILEPVIETVDLTRDTTAGIDLRVPAQFKYTILSLKSEVILNQSFHSDRSMDSIFKPSFVDHCKRLARQAETPIKIQVQLIPGVWEFKVDTNDADLGDSPSEDENEAGTREYQRPVPKYISKRRSDGSVVLVTRSQASPEDLEMIRIKNEQID